eukprot:6483559-Amphidinium_carterae.1
MSLCKGIDHCLPLAPLQNFKIAKGVLHKTARYSKGGLLWTKGFSFVKSVLLMNFIEGVCLYNRLHNVKGLHSFKGCVDGGILSIHRGLYKTSLYSKGSVSMHDGSLGRVLRNDVTKALVKFIASLLNGRTSHSLTFDNSLNSAARPPASDSQ